MPSTKPETSIPIIITTTDASAPNTPDFKGGMVDRSLLHCSLRTSDTTWRAPDSPLSATSSNGSDDYFDDCSAASPSGSVESVGSFSADQHYPFPISEDFSSLVLDPQSPSDIPSPFDFDTSNFGRAASSPELNITGYPSDWTSSATSPDAPSGYYPAPPGLGPDHNLSPIYSEDFVGQWIDLYPSSNSGELLIGESFGFDDYLPEHSSSSPPGWRERAESRENNREDRRHSPYPRSRSNSRVGIHTEVLDHLSPSNFLTGGSDTISLDDHLSPQFLAIPTVSNRGYTIDSPHSPSASPNVSSSEPSPLLHAYTPDSRPYQIQDPIRGVEDFAPQSSPIDVPQTSTRRSGNAFASSSKTPDTKFRPEVGSAAMVQACHERRKPENKEGAFHCTEPGCMANFTAKHNLMNHINSHKGIRKFECSRCERKFGTRHVLTRHLRSCKGPKKYGQLTAF